MSCPMSSLLHPESSVLLNSSPDMGDGPVVLGPLESQSLEFTQKHAGLVLLDGYIQEKTNLPPPSF